jgi:hypothetical protein
MTGMVSIRHLIEHSVFADANKLSKNEFITRHFDMTDEEFIAYVMANGIPGFICYDPEDDTVYDGHKRIILAWLLGIETIEYAFGESQLLFDLED